MLPVIFYILRGALAAAAFLSAWRRLPASWLFDTDDASPHPLSEQALSFPLNLAAFFFFITSSLLLSENVAQIHGFWLLGLLWLLAQISLADACYRLIPDQWSLGLTALGILKLLWLSFSHALSKPGNGAPVASFFAMTLEYAFSQLNCLFICAFLFLFFYALPRRLWKRPFMGLGDIKLLFALAVALPSSLFFSSLLHSFLLGGAFAVILLVFRQAERGVPFGTALALCVGWECFFFR